MSLHQSKEKGNAMKKFLFVLMALPVLAFKCGKSSQAKDGYLTGKVIRISCASFVIQVLNDDTVGEDGWKDMTNNNNTVYDNVFTANNPCKIGENIKAGNTIRFKIDPPTQNDCVLCMMYDGPPNAKYDVSDITLIEEQH
jgi:hypothetical protein